MNKSVNNNAINLNELICFNFYSGSREVEQLFRCVVGNDMTIQKSFVLSYLHKTQKNMKEISKHLNLDSSAVSTLVDRMFKKGLIIRDRQTDDRRVILVGLTEKGESLRDELEPKVQLFNTKLSEGISDEERRFLVETIEKIKTNHLAITSPEAVK